MQNTIATRQASKPRPNRPKRPTRKGTGSQKLKSVDPSIDEGYHSGNPPPLLTTQVNTKSDSSGSPAHVLNGSGRLETGGPTRSHSESTMSKLKSDKALGKDNHPTVRSNSTMATATAAAAAKSTITNNVDQALASAASSRPKLLQRSESRTFVFIYDEDAKTSKPVSAPDALNVDVPVLLQYGLTDDAIEKCLDAPDVGASPTDREGPPGDVDVADNNNDSAGAKDGGGSFCSPTERLLRSREKDELKNRGMHVVKWLVGLEKTDTAK